MILNRMSWTALFLSLLLVGCGDGSEERRADAGTRDGVLHFGNGTEVQGLDPHIVTGIPEHHVVSALFEGLTSKNPYTLESEPAAAKSWEISEDGLIYTFHLREDAQWTNGDPLTAEDFRWSFERALTPALGNQNNYMLFPIANAEAFANGEITDFKQVGAKVIDQTTFEVTLRAPTPYFLQLLDHYIAFPVHRANVETFGSYTDRVSQWAREGNIVNNGAFELTEWQVNSHIRVEKRVSYWDAENIKLNAIVYYPTENLVTEERMFRDGQLHRTNDIPLDKVPVYLADDPEHIVIAPYLGTYFYMINTTREPLDDVRVRQALALSIDRKLLNETVLEGIMDPSYALVPPGTLGYQPPQTLSYDPDRARDLLAEAGFPDGEGFPAFELLYNTQENHRKIAIAIQQMWQADLGISVSLLNQEWRVYLNSQENQNYDVSRRGWIGDYVDPNTFLDMYITDGGNNKTGFSNPRYDQLVLGEAPTKLNQDERFALYYEAESILMQEVPIIPIYTYQTKNLKDPSLKGAPSNIMDHYNWKYVYLEASE
ncbi:MAG: peptide ABC transporter substrate-binding protein [Gammaproteobacteria bacterium]|jgi:oligopeptide transport system substrate-binding protein|nr:peptide ABC transporter substrate-binding protein [Gammaproteobacteria bacterium]